MIIYLNVPFDDRHKAKSAGAKWNAARKRWYVENMEDLSSVRRWMDSHLNDPHKETPYERAFKERQIVQEKQKKHARHNKRERC